MKKKMRQFLSLMLAIVFVLGIQPAAYGSASPSGSIVDGVLTISGSGELATSLYSSNTNIHTLIINEGITAIGLTEFSDCTNLKEVHLPKSLLSINRSAFAKCNIIETVYYAGTESEKEALLNGIKDGNNFLINAEWICSDTVVKTENSLVFSDATVKTGDTASVTLSIGGECSRLAAALTVKATDADGNALPISGVVLNSELTGAVNRNNNGTISFSYDNNLDAGSILATISFKCDTVGVYTVSIDEANSEMYTGANNTPVDFTVTPGTVTVEKRTVSVVWKDHDGDTLYSAEIEPGAEHDYVGTNPVREADTYYTYTFSNWENTSDEGSENIEYTAVYTATARTYSVSISCGVNGADITVKDSDGNTVSKNSEGLFELSATESYSCTVKAIGYEALSFTLKMDSDSSSWVIDSENSSAVYTTAALTLALGDLNDDGSVDITDAQALHNYLAGNYTLTDGLAYEGNVLVFNFAVADINENGRVGADDILPMLDLINDLKNG